LLLPLDGGAEGLHVVAMAPQKKIYICINKKGGAACLGPQSREVFRALRKRARERGGAVAVERIECMGDCSYGPNVKVHGGPVFHEVALDDVERILDEAERQRRLPDTNPAHIPSSPRRRPGPMALSIELIVKIGPLRVHGLDQIDLPCPPLFLDALFTHDGVFHGGSVFNSVAVDDVD